MMSSTTYQRWLAVFFRRSGVGVIVFLFCVCFLVGFCLGFFVVFPSLLLSPTPLNTNSLPRCIPPPFTAAVIYIVIPFFTAFYVKLLQLAVPDTGIPSVFYLSATAGLESIKNLARESKNYIVST